MRKKSLLRKTFKGFLVFFLVFSWLFSGWPAIWITPQFQFPPKIKEVQAETITDTYSTAGSFTWTAPTGITSATVACWGGGGGGGVQANQGGGGGGGGAYASSTVSVTPGTGYAVVVGAGGVSDSLVGGGDSTFASTVVVADGGLGSDAGATAGAGGIVANSTGSVTFAGGNGAIGLGTNDTGGGGGGAAGPNGAGGGGTAGTATVGGVGGAGNTGSGGAGGTSGNAAAGGAGGAHATGGGGGGGGDNTFKGGDGGAPGGGAGGGEVGANTGAAGQCTITYTNVTILGNGASEPSNTTIGPSGSITDLDNFTLQTAATTDTVTAAVVTLGPVGAFNNIAQVDITDSTNTAKCTAVTGLISNTVSFSTCNISVGVGATAYKVRITPKTHANMTVPPGASYDTTGTVTSFTSTNAQSVTDTGSATITVDNLSPNGATLTSGTAGNTAVTLNWTTSNSADFATTNGSVVLRWAAASAGTEVPAEGTTSYAAGNAIGTATVACVISSSASTAQSKVDGTGGSVGCTTVALTNGQAYTYKVFQVDTNGNYDTGVSIGSFTPVLVSITITTDGTVAYGYVAEGATKSTVQLSDTQTANNDGSGTETFNIKTSNATGGTQWTLGATPGTDVFVHEFSTNGGAGWTVFTTADTYQTLATNIGVGSTQNFDLRITAPNPSSDAIQKSITITIQAVQ